MTLPKFLKVGGCEGSNQIWGFVKCVNEVENFSEQNEEMRGKRNQ